MRVYVDIGHGGSDPGAVSGNLIEHKMNQNTGQALAERLKQYGFEVKVESGNLSINDSAKAANNFKADLLISCHYNAGGGDRGEVIHSIRSGSGRLANAVAAGLKAAGQTVVKTYTKLNSAGNADYYGILRISSMPAVIIEPAFIDNATDRQIADTEEEQRNIGYCIADAIAAEYGGKKIKEGEVMSETNKTGDNPSEWAKEHTEWAKEKGIIHGDGKGNYDWQGPVTREGMAAMLHAFAITYGLEEQ